MIKPRISGNPEELSSSYVHAFALILKRFEAAENFLQGRLAVLLGSGACDSRGD